MSFISLKEKMDVDQSQEVLRNLLSRASGLDAWLLDLYSDEPEAISDIKKNELELLSHLDQYLNEEFSLNVRPDGLIEFYTLPSKTARLIGNAQVVLFHFTSSRLEARIRREGLVPGRTNVNRTNGEEAAGVYLTTETSGPAVSGYASRAKSLLGGESILVEVKRTLAQLQRDPDDADIQSGNHQFITPEVPPSDIVSIEPFSPY